MKVLNCRNAHQALPRALQMLDEDGVRRESRYGPVLHYPEPVSTVYANPQEKVVWWPERDYNIAFVLYEALWMLAGRNDVEPLTRYVKTFGEFSDDGTWLAGAYGKRWRNWFNVGGRFSWGTIDQLEIIIKRLKENQEDRRCVLQMWDPELDLNSNSKDVPCNTTVTFQRGAHGELNMVVFCRSNDILFGAYYANAFHFGFLLEYMAHRIGCPVGAYTQVSVNFHGYLKTLESVKSIPRPNFGEYYISPPFSDPYTYGRVATTPLTGDVDKYIHALLDYVDSDFQEPYSWHINDDWVLSTATVLYAHHLWRTQEPPDNFKQALKALSFGHDNWDWIAAMREWIQRREERWQKKSL